MPLKRFYVINRCLRSDERSTRSHRRGRDKMAPIRDVYEKKWNWNSVITWEKLQQLTNRLSDSSAAFHSNNICPTNQTHTDQLIETYNFKRKIRRRPNVLFFYILNTSALNGYIVFSELFPDWRKGDSKERRHYLRQLGKDLCKPLIEKRSALPRGNSVLSTRKNMS